MEEIGLQCARSGSCALRSKMPLSLPVRWATPALLRPSFTLGGAGGGIAYDLSRSCARLWRRVWSFLPLGEVLVEEKHHRLEEYEMEVMRDKAGNGIIVCSIENVDAMGVHTGDSITVAPAQTLSDVEYQRMRVASLAILEKIGVETGGSNVQFALNPKNGRLIVIRNGTRAGEPLIGARVEGDRFPHRESCCAPGRGLHAR